VPLLEEGDMIADGGNSHFEDTFRREQALKKEGILFLGCGISGGEKGALNGPCIMPGGSSEAYKLIEQILNKCAAQLPEGPCSAYLGPHAAGHYVKMVHNGIEYGFMQVLAEAYDIMRRILNFRIEEISRVFEKWNKGLLASYLVEITASILNKKDPVSGNPLVEMILDRAGQKGTGKWTSQSALDLGVPIPTIHAAISARILSGYLEERREIAELYPTKPPFPLENSDEFIQILGKALYAAQILTYAQGMALLQKASEEYNFDLQLDTIARIWKGGCIIRAKLLDRIQRIYKNNPKLFNMVIDPELKNDLTEGSSALRAVVKITTDCSVPSPALSAALNYFDSFKTKNLPVNLIQAQRDYFGAHTYQRIDREGSFHTLWDKEE
jgi:6-phosphogluconate dehydrogenase